METIQINKSARYETFGNISKADTIVFALHGYGQLVSYFIKKFNTLNPKKYFIVAPEGLHRFYLNGASGRVGASWMTKEERENDIKDYINYLNHLWKNIQTEKKFETKVLLGFSQGGATACRWHEFGNFQADKLFLWSAVFPPDIQLHKSSAFLYSENTFVYGDEDKYYTENEFENHILTLNKMGLPFKSLKFKGEHQIYPEILVNLLPWEN